jgi:hypothetical protein
MASADCRFARDGIDRRHSESAIRLARTRDGRNTARRQIWNGCWSLGWYSRGKNTGATGKRRCDTCTVNNSQAEKEQYGNSKLHTDRTSHRRVASTKCNQSTREGQPYTITLHRASEKMNGWSTTGGQRTRLLSLIARTGCPRSSKLLSPAHQARDTRRGATRQFDWRTISQEAATR